MSWVVFMISGVLLSAYAVIFYFYLQKTKLRKASLQAKEVPSSKQKAIEEELTELEHIQLDLPTGVCVLPQGTSDPSLRQESNIDRNSH